MKNLIVTIWIEKESTKSMEAMSNFLDRLIQNKADYAEKIGVDFLCLREMSNDLNEDSFTSVNLWKHKMMIEKSKEYDNILYCDMDVVFDTDENIFDLDMKYVYAKNSDWSSDPRRKQRSKVSPWNKKKIASELLGKEVKSVFNTGMILISAENIRKMNFMEEFEKVKHIEYPNNEAIFSYLLEKNEIPHKDFGYWNHVVAHSAQPFEVSEVKKFKSYHFINKNFPSFFEKKKKLIFSMHIEIPKERLDFADEWKDDKQKEKDFKKANETKQNFLKYNDRLIENKQKYADAIGAEFIHVTENEEYEEFRKRCLATVPSMSEYNIINFFKLWLFEIFFRDYDEILYLDHDVFCVDEVDFFYYHDLDSAYVCSPENMEDLWKEMVGWIDAAAAIHYRSPMAKMLNAMSMAEMMGEFDIEKISFNTGIIGFGKNIWQQFGFFEEFEEDLKLMTELIEGDNGDHPLIQKCFGYDNETLFTYKFHMKQEIPLTRINHRDWHMKLHGIQNGQKDLLLNSKENDVHFCHLINKRFDWCFDD